MKKIIAILGLFIIGIGYTFAFENTFYPYVPVEINDGQSNVLQLTDNVNFLLNDTYKVISVYGDGDYPRLKNVFWNGTGLYFIDSCAGGYSCTNINTSIKKQGYIQKYYECTLNNGICDVSNSPLKDVSEFVGNSQYSDPDYMLISDSRWNNSSLFVCFKYENLNKQLCFQFSEDASYYSNSIGFTYNPKPSQFIDSNNQIVEYFSNSPFSPETTPTTPDTNEVCITVQELFDMQSNNYSTGLCYSDNKYLTQSGRVQITQKFITELYPTYTELRQDRNTRQNYCQPPATQQTCQTAFNGKEENRTLLNKIPMETDLTVLYDYCYTYQTRSGNMQKNFCDMTPEEQQKIRPSQMTTEGYAERIAKHPTTTTTPTTGTVYDGLTDGTNRDILEAIPRVYTKITGIFKGRTGKNGIIPYYITGILLVIVLFKLFKK